MAVKMQDREKNPLISVIVPAHNAQDFLEDCVDSILAQTYRPLEILLVNDGSRDRTGQVCQKLQKAHENIVVISMEDKGVSAARNAGIERAQGAYVTFVDMDDRIHPLMLEVLYRELTRTKSDLAGCGFFCWSSLQEWERGAHDGETKESAGRIFTQKEFVLQGILQNDIRCWSKLYKKDCLQNVRFREGLTIGEDMLFLVDLAPYLTRTVSVDFAGYGYFQNPAGAMNRKFVPAYMDQIRCWKMAGEQLSDWAEVQEGLTRQETEGFRVVLAARLMTGILLTAGKLAELENKERRAYQSYVRDCHGQLRECLRQGASTAGLDAGYRCKVKFFAAFPAGYMWLYGLWKKGRK